MSIRFDEAGFHGGDGSVYFGISILHLVQIQVQILIALHIEFDKSIWILSGIWIFQQSEICHKLQEQ